MKLLSLIIFYVLSNLYHRFQTLVTVRSCTEIDPARKILILGNGPSLTDDLPAIKSQRDTSYIVGTNFIVNTNLYPDLQPDFIFISDPLFVSSSLSSNYTQKVDLFFRRLAKTNWQLSVYMPDGFKHHFQKLLSAYSPINPDIISLYEYPFSTRFLGNPDNRSLLFDLKVTSPLLTNVVASALYFFLMTSKSTINLYGCDSDAFMNLKVNQQTNFVHSGYSHFYNPSERHEYKYQDSTSLYVRFKQFYLMYSELQALSYLADRRSLRVVNMSSRSMLDCFSRPT